MKRFLSVLLSLLMMLTCVPLGAVSVSAEGVVNGMTYEINNGEVTITGCTDDVPATLRIPASINGYPVIAIGDRAFYDCTKLEEVLIAEGVTTIGDLAFAYCGRLDTLVVPKSVVNFGDSPFTYTGFNSGADSLGFFYVETELDSESAWQVGPYTPIYPVMDGVIYAYDEYSTIEIVGHTSEMPKNLVIPSTVYGKPVTSIGMIEGYYYRERFRGAFEDSHLETVVLPDSLCWISSNAFSGSSLKSVTIPDSVTSIGGYQDITVLGQKQGAFTGCKELETVTLGKGLNTIEEEVFAGCTSLRYVKIPEGVTSICSGAFAGCTALTSITIPNSVTDLVGLIITPNYNVINGPFVDCSSLETVVLGTGISTVGSYTFSGCSSLRNIYYAGSEEDRANVYVDIEGNDSLLSATWHYNLEGFYNGLLYEIADGEVTITGYTNDLPAEVVIPSTIGGYPVVEIGEGAFWHNAYITSVTIPDGVREIGSGAFRYCVNLISVDMADDVIEIGSHAFCNNDNLTTVKLSKSITKLNLGVFGCCPKLAEITIPDGVTLISEEAFLACASLTSITIPESVAYIHPSAFDDCTSLSEIILPDDIPQMGAQFYNTAYYNNDANWEEGALYLGSYLIGTRNDLSNRFVVKEGTKKISGGFVRCSSLHSIVLPKSVVSIETLFYGCTSLTHVYYAGTEQDRANIEITYADSPLLSATWHYNSGVYNGMMYENINDGMTITGYTEDLPANLVIPDTIGGYPVTAIGNGAFIGCASLTSITIPDSVISIDGEAFMSCTALTSVILPNGITRIPYWAFMGCSSLTSVVIPDSVTRIGESAFYNCTSLASVTLPKSVTSIEFIAFDSCPSLTNVYYSGTEENRANIGVDVGNDSLLNATWHYNYVEPTELFYPIVTHSVMDTTLGTGLAYRFWLSVRGMTVTNGNVADYTNATVNYLGTDCKLLGMGAVVTNSAAVGEDAASLTLNSVNDQNVLDIPAVYLTHLTADACAFAVRIIDIPEEQMDRIIYARPYYIVEVNGEAVTVYGDIDAASCRSVSNNIA